MFDLGKPIPGAFSGEISEADPRIVGVDSRGGSARGETSRGGDALRAIEWRELTARLNAARELRRELRQEAILCSGASGAAFGDAAARFFNTLGDGERPVNPEALEACKSLRGTPSEQSGAAARSDARDQI